MKSTDVVKVKIHPEGHVFVALFVVVALGLSFLSVSLGWVGGLLAAWCVYFFRDPERVVPTAKGVIVSPADGVISAISEVKAPAELDMGDAPMTRISIFLSVFNVHVNRLPAGGVVEKSVYVPGKFLNAADDNASEQNERQLVRMKTDSGTILAFTQVAGLVARRIFCYLDEGQAVTRGERFGIIRFGSRTDIYLPKGTEIRAAVGQIMIGGETVIAQEAKTTDG